MPLGTLLELGEEIPIPLILLILWLLYKGKNKQGESIEFIKKNMVSSDDHDKTKKKIDVINEKLIEHEKIYLEEKDLTEIKKDIGVIKDEMRWSDVCDGLMSTAQATVDAIGKRVDRLENWANGSLKKGKL